MLRAEPRILGVSGVNLRPLYLLMAKQLNILPDSLVAGETISETIQLTDYPAASGWAISYRFSAPTPFAQACTGGTAGAWGLALTSAQTLSLPAGAIRFDAIATQTVGEAVAQVVAVDSGQITVAASPLLTSKWTAVLTAVEAEIANFGSNSSRAMSIEGMSVTYRDLSDLMALRTFCIGQIARETGNRRPSIIRARFT